jgi:hypothetical protein
VLASYPSGSVVADDVHGAGGTSIEMVPPSLFADPQIAWFLPASITMSFRQRRPLVSFRPPEFSKLQTSEGQGPPMQRHAPQERNRNCPFNIVNLLGCLMGANVWCPS